MEPTPSWPTLDIYSLLSINLSSNQQEPKLQDMIVTMKTTETQLIQFKYMKSLPHIEVLNRKYNSV